MVGVLTDPRQQPPAASTTDRTVSIALREAVRILARPEVVPANELLGAKTICLRALYLHTEAVAQRTAETNRLRREKRRLAKFGGVS
jgi:hypothetical protein